ncbi:MAG TPA: arginase family protein [Gemmatimonadaceae bacterium]|nr:arginase family protein [Gemmatimonadaceae bacterium]
MRRPIALIGAPSSIGIRPYDDGAARRLDLAPGALREQGLADRIAAHDLGDVVPPSYRDFVRPNGRPRNEDGVAIYSRQIAARMAEAWANEAFTLLLGGDCSIVLGALLGARQAGRSRVGLVYVDAHADFATPTTSRTGSAASMCLALAVGRGDTPLARLDEEGPLVRGEDVVLIGRRDDWDEPWYGEDALRASPVLDLTHASLRTEGATSAARAAIDRLAPNVDGFWIHVDADVLDPTVLPAVDSPEPGGLSLEELGDLLTPLTRHPAALGLELTIYDPALDPDRSSAARLAALLQHVLAGDSRPSTPAPGFWERLARSYV